MRWTTALEISSSFEISVIPMVPCFVARRNSTSAARSMVATLRPLVDVDTDDSSQSEGVDPVFPYDTLQAMFHWAKQCSEQPRVRPRPVGHHGIAGCGNRHERRRGVDDDRIGGIDRLAERVCHDGSDALYAVAENAYGAGNPPALATRPGVECCSSSSSQAVDWMRSPRSRPVSKPISCNR